MKSKALTVFKQLQESPLKHNPETNSLLSIKTCDWLGCRKAQYMHIVHTNWRTTYILYRLCS